MIGGDLGLVYTNRKRETRNPRGIYRLPINVYSAKKLFRNKINSNPGGYRIRIFVAQCKQGLVIS